ncbi:hypothetical protein J6590_045560 [Homalodisca vitripennis]|nr:hypothetical protein J6590_045560 [Homalodisca vitripennis]
MRVEEAVPTMPRTSVTSLGTGYCPEGRVADGDGTPWLVGRQTNRLEVVSGSEGWFLSGVGASRRTKTTLTNLPHLGLTLARLALYLFLSARHGGLEIKRVVRGDAVGSRPVIMKKKRIS